MRVGNEGWGKDETTLWPNALRPLLQGRNEHAAVSQRRLEVDYQQVAGTFLAEERTLPTPNGGSYTFRFSYGINNWTNYMNMDNRGCQAGRGTSGNEPIRSERSRFPFLLIQPGMTPGLKIPTCPIPTSCPMVLREVTRGPDGEINHFNHRPPQGDGRTSCSWTGRFVRSDLKSCGL